MHKNKIFPLRMEKDVRQMCKEMAARSRVSESAAIRMAIVFAYEKTMKKGRTK